MKHDTSNPLARLFYLERIVCGIYHYHNKVTGLNFLAIVDDFGSVQQLSNITVFGLFVEEQHDSIYRMTGA